MTRLDIVDCAGEALPVSLTSTNFPSLETLTLDLVKPRRQKLVDTYRSPGGMTQPPNVRALALRGDGYRFTHELLAAQTHLEHLRLGVSRENTAAYLASLRGSLLSLWVEHSVKDTRDPIGTLAFLPPLDPQTAAHTFNHSSLKHIALSYYDSTDQTVDFDDDWLLSFGRAIAQAMSARGLDLEVRWATDTRKVDEWDPRACALAFSYAHCADVKPLQSSATSLSTSSGLPWRDELEARGLEGSRVRSRTGRLLQCLPCLFCRLSFSRLYECACAVWSPVASEKRGLASERESVCAQRERATTRSRRRAPLFSLQTTRALNFRPAPSLRLGARALD